MKKITFIIITLLYCLIIQAQEKNINYAEPQIFEVGGIIVKGANHLNEKTLIAISELSIGENIKIPGDAITNAIKKLWDQGLFSDVSISIDKKINNSIFLSINLKEHARLSQFKFKGKKISKSDITNLKEELKLMRGKVLTQNLIQNSLQKISKYYVNKGFYNVQVGYVTNIDSSVVNGKNLIFNINKGDKMKIKEIYIKGRKKIANDKHSLLNPNDSVYALSNKKIKKSMKDTKVKNFWRFWKTSKFIDENWTNDKKNIIEKYNQIGYRDAQITHDTSYINDDNTITIEITINEGKPYRFGSIDFIGNSIYSSSFLYQKLGIKEGDIFDQ